MISRILYVTQSIMIIVLLNLPSVVYSQSESEGTILRLAATDSVNHVRIGTGFVVSGHNYIITAYHVVQNARTIAIDRPQSMQADDLKIISSYPDIDIAILKIPEELLPKLVPFKSGRAGTSSSKTPIPISVLGYGSVIDRNRPQKYSGYHENAPFVKSRDWNKPAEIPGPRGPMFNNPDIELLMLQVPSPYGLSGGPVINQAGEVIGVISGALTRLENVASLGWAIPIKYALKHAMHAPNGVQLITDKDVYLRVFGGPQVSLVNHLICSDSIKRIDTAWDTTANAIAELQGYLTSARVSVDVGARQARSRETANNIMNEQMHLLVERFAKVRNDATAYKQQIVVAANDCNRDIDAVKEAIGKLPKTAHNEQLEKGVKELSRKVINNVNIKTQESNVKVEYELKKYWAKVASIEPLSDEGSSFLSRPSRSIESDIQQFLQYIDAMEFIIKSAYLGVFKDVYRELESELDSYRIWIESTNSQPWDRS